MTRRRKRLLSIAGVIAVAALILLTFLATRPEPQPVFRLREVISYVMPLRPQPSVLGRRGDRVVQAEFEYVGPPVTPVGREWRWLLSRLRLTRPPPVVEWVVEDIVLVDERGNELSRLAPMSATTRPFVHAGFTEVPEKRQLIHSWMFDLPPGIDPSKPVMFRTRLGLNQHPPVVIEAKLPVVTAASKPATTSASAGTGVSR